MRYFALETTFVLGTREDTFIIGSAFDANFNKIKFKHGGFAKGGTSLKNFLNLPLTLVVNENESFCGICQEVMYTSSSLGTIILFQEGLKNAIEDLCADDVEFYQIHIKGKNINREDYYAMNILNRIDCVDKEKSEYVDKYGFITNLTSFVIEEEKIPKELRIYKIDKTVNSFPMIVRQDFAQIFIDRKVKDVNFTAIEEFVGG